MAGKALFTIETIRAAKRGLYELQSLEIAWLDSEVILTGRVVGIGNRISACTDMRLHEDIHANQVLSMEVK